MPDIALTGTSGHLGMVVQKMLVSDGISHRVLLRRPVDYIHSGDIVYGDLEDGSVRRALLEQSQTVIHCAAKVWPRTGRNASVIHTNYELTRALFEDAVQAGVQHFIYISSIHSMVAPPPDSVFDESAGLSEDPNRPYDFSKAESERFLRRRTEMRVTIINPTAIIGPGDHYFRGMNQLFTRLYRGRLPAVTAGGFNIVDVRDAARAILTTAVKQQEGKYILTGSYYEILELARKYADLTGRKVPSLIIRPGWMRFLARVSVPIDRLASKPLALNTYAVETLLEGHQNLSAGKAERDLGFSSRPVEETLNDLDTWFTDEKLIL